MFVSFVFVVGVYFIPAFCSLPTFGTDSSKKVLLDFAKIQTQRSMALRLFSTAFLSKVCWLQNLDPVAFFIL